MDDLPYQTIVNRFIPKNKFYEVATVSTGVRREFVDLIERITWLYKLSEDTLGASKTNKVEEIQIFKVLLKKKQLPKNAIRLITRNIAYPILFHYRFEDEFIYSIEVDEKQYYTKWNEDISFNFSGLNLEVIYENIVKAIIKEEISNEDFEEIISKTNKKTEVERLIQITKNKMKREKQFNRKVELNQELYKLENKLEELNE